MYETKPWLKYYGNVPCSIDYPKITMYQSVMRSAEKYPQSIAYDFMGYTCTYKEFAAEIAKFSDALYALGLRQGDRITISMPTTPQGIICFYAANRLGAVASMIHPLSTPKEIEFYLNVSKSKFALTVDMFYDKFGEILNNTGVTTLILTKIGDYLPLMKWIAYNVIKQRTIQRPPSDKRIKWWKDIMRQKYPPAPKSTTPALADDMAVILYSGGTTGVPKGIMLSNYNFISEGMMVAEWARQSGGSEGNDSVLAILPIFHGFGLGVCVNGAFMGGGKSILVPQFDPKIIAKIIKKKKPSFMVGVPTLFEALNRNKDFCSSDLSCLKATFCGADTLPSLTKKDFEKTVSERGGSVKLLEGYGLTEAVTAIMATPMTEYRTGSIGIPFPDMLAKVVKPDTIDEAALGEDGELCVCGPAVMLGYLDQPEETASVLKKHADGRIWLHTGDMACMDKDGFFYFKLRLKRMIKSSGMNVYPAQVEETLRTHPCISETCVIGVPDKSQVERVKAFVVLKDNAKACEELKKDIINHCSKTLIKWSCPREIEFRDCLPKTLVGKIAYKELQDQEIKLMNQCKE